jgi:hypothetical protein
MVTVKSAKSAKSSTTAPITPAPTDMLPSAVATLANAAGKDQSQAIIDALRGYGLTVASAALSMHKGNTTAAANDVGLSVVPTIHLIARIIPILRSTAPSALFTDGNNRGARIGELFAGKLGLSALYRVTTRANLKDARAALVEAAK